MIGFCFNQLSCNTVDKYHASKLTRSMYEGLQTIIKARMDNAVMYADNIMGNIELCNGYTHNDFVNEIKYDDREFYAFIVEIDDHSPFLDKLTNHEQNDILDFGSYFTLADKSLDNIEYLYIFAQKNNYYIASLASDNKWESSNLKFAYSDSNSQYKNCMLLNVAGYDTGYYHINGVLPLELHKYDGRIRYSKHFTEWFNSLDDNKKEYAISRIKQADGVRFSCEPVTKRLHFTLSKSISAIRGNNLPEGAGTMRILYYDEGGIVSILYGFIKEGNSDGYKLAEQCCKQLLIDVEWAE